MSREEKKRSRVQDRPPSRRPTSERKIQVNTEEEKHEESKESVSMDSMPITRQDIERMDKSKLATYVAIGTLGGLGYGLWQWFVTEKYPVNHLVPKPQAFGMDPRAGDIYARLAPLVEPTTKPLYSISLLRCDALLQLERALRKVKSKPRDLVDAERYVRQCKLYAHKMRHNTKNKRSLVVMEEILGELDFLLEDHLQHVTQLCRS